MKTEAAISRHVAIDLGASGGRIAVGSVQNESVEVEVVHRFPNHPIVLPTGLYWDVLALWREILYGLKLAGDRGAIASVGVNTWGVDFALLDANSLLIDGAHHYRDPRTDGVMDRLFKSVARDDIYKATGIQFMPLNTLFQVIALEDSTPGTLARADTLLMMPDLFHYWLCGRKATERTIASTSQLYDPRAGDWSSDLIRRCKLPRHLFQEIVEPGTALGEVRAEIGLAGAKVIAPAAHDTASAVAAVPAEGENWAYISCGTWALVGIEAQRPIINADTLARNLTNEAGVNGTTRLLKNIVGLWILQECRRAWGDPPYETLYAEAAALPTGGSKIDPDDPRFMAPGEDMPERVAKLALTGAPRGRAEITRCILDSLAEKCAAVIRELELATGEQISTVHIVGGGSQIALLNQLIANATRRPVIAGPVEATLYGNLLVQAEAVSTIPQGSIRDVVRRSEKLTRFEPA